VVGGILFDLALARGEPGIVWYDYGLVGVFIAAGLAFWARKGRRLDAGVQPISGADE